MPAIRSFGTTPDGQTVHQYTLRSDRLQADILTLGGFIRTLNVDGTDVALGYDHLQPYLGEHPFFGCITGRVAGRITDGRFALDGKTYQLALNDSPNNLHGGPHGFERALWQPEPDGDHTLRLTHLSPDGDQGFPGNLAVDVTYRLDDDTLRIDYHATTDAPTPFAPTNHTYFNLAGHDAGDALDHLVHIHARRHIPADPVGTLTGRVDPVEGTGHDFRSPKPLRDQIDRIPQQHGTKYLLDGTPGTLRDAATLHHPPTGRTLHCRTTERCLQFYTGVKLDNEPGKNDARYPSVAGLCLETQPYPDTLNAANNDLGDNVLRPGQTYRQTTTYRFT
jgi:aldose 1-epimerase